MEEPHQRSGEQGQVLPLLALVLLLAAGGALVLGRLAVGTVTHARATTAADAAALAAVAGTEADARQLAARNGARVVSFERLDGGDVRVRIELDGVRASARARPGPPPHPEGPRGLAPAMRAALARAEELLGRRVPITSGYRSPAMQQALWERRATNPYPVARPGSSMHERGLAIDVPLAFAPTLASVAERAGLCRPHADDPVHFEPCGRGFTRSAPG